MRYFYGRVSSKDQNLDRQLEVAATHKCEAIYTDKQSGKDLNRPSYLEMREKLVKGDEVFIKELDRLGRNKEEVKKEIQWYKENGIILRILNIPTTLIDFQGQDWIGDMVTNILIEVLSTIAEEERVKIKQRQSEGIRIAKEKGVKFGREEVDQSKVELVNSLTSLGTSIVEACKQAGISRSTYYKYSN